VGCLLYIPRSLGKVRNGGLPGYSVGSWKRWGVTDLKLGKDGWGWKRRSDVRQTYDGSSGGCPFIYLEETVQGV